MSKLFGKKSVWTVGIIVIGLVLAFAYDASLRGGNGSGDRAGDLPDDELLQTTPADSKTYKNNELNYEFQYPANWRLSPATNGDTSFYIFYRVPEPEADYEGYFIYGAYISQSQLNMMGINYCEANPNDSSRCENTKVGGQRATIDWGLKENDQTRASVWILHPKGGIVTFELKPVIPEIKPILYQILSTFKFLDADV